MKVSICITVFNEEDTIAKLLDSIFAQTKKADEIIIVDGGSTDRTVEIAKHFQKKNKSIKLLIEKCSRARGRNLGVEAARNEIIAVTDAGCVAEKHWLERITEPLIHLGGVKAHPRGVYNEMVCIIAGFYEMTAENSLQKAEKVFLGVLPQNFDVNFLPSTRSIAFRKSTWEQLGGFPENLAGAAEDTVFNYKGVKTGVKIVRVKNAIVEWGMPDSITNFQFKIFNYAKGDAKSKIWFFPGRGLWSHNIHSLLIVSRYLIGVAFLIAGVLFNWTFAYLYILVLIGIYLFWSYRKAGAWGPVLQIVSDFAVMGGFISGFLGR